MLKKLYKYEFISLFRILLPIYGAVVGFAVINRLSFLLNFSDNSVLNILQVFTVAAYVISVIAVLAVGFITVIIRFYKNMLTDEGYLTHTLPATISNHITCKFLCGMVVVISNIIVVIVSLLLLGFGTDTMKNVFNDIKGMWDYYSQVYGTENLIFTGILIIVLIIISIGQVLNLMYASMSVGQMFKNKIIGSVVAYFVFYYIMQIVILILMLPVLLNAEKFENWMESSISGIQITVGCISFLYLLIAIGYWFVTRYFLTKKLNLE